MMSRESVGQRQCTNPSMRTVPIPQPTCHLDIATLDNKYPATTTTISQWTAILSGISRFTCARAMLLIQRTTTWSTTKFSVDRPVAAREAAVARYPWLFGLEARLCVHLLPFLHYDSIIIIAQQPDRAASWSVSQARTRTLFLAAHYIDHYSTLLIGRATRKTM